MTTFRPIPIPATRASAATPYGFMLDHIWASEDHAARRPHWPDDMFISVQACIDLDEETEANQNVGAMKRWVFWSDSIEYTPLHADLAADDWLVTP